MRKSLAAMVVAFVVAILAADADVAVGAVFSVTKTADTADGVCDADCSVREAVIEANLSPGTDTVVVPAGEYMLTIVGKNEDESATGDLDVTGELTLEGSAAATTIIQACNNPGGTCENADRVLDVDPLMSGVLVTLTRLTLRNGNLSGSEDGGVIRSQGELSVAEADIAGGVAGQGGGIFNSAAGFATLTRVKMHSNAAFEGGAIHTLGNMRVTDSTIENNQAVPNFGGAISNRGELTVSRTTMRGNQGFGGGGAVFNYGLAARASLNSALVVNNTAHAGGGIESTAFASLTLSETTISGNISNFGGGMFTGPGTVTGLAVVVDGNSAFSLGGGILNTGPANLSLTNSSIVRNTSGDAGGGLFNERDGDATISYSTIDGNVTDGTGGGIENEGTLTLDASTISANEARGSGSFGGGIKNEGGTVYAVNSTISGNSAVSVAGGLYTSAPFASTQPAVNLVNVSIVGNSASGGDGIYSFEAVGIKNSLLAFNTPDCSGPISSNGHNLSTDPTCALNGPGDLKNVRPQLGLLENNAGATKTHALLPRSIGLDAGDNDGCPLLDQRGSPRPTDGDGDSVSTCDVGAYELGDADAVHDAAEIACGSNFFRPDLIPERLDTVGDDDGDGLVNEALPAGSDAYDCDGDGFSGSTERYVFSAANTAHDQACANAWPPDINNNGFVDIIADLVTVANHFGELPAPVRYDIAPDPPDGVIDVIGDLVRVANLFGESCAQ